MSRLLRDLRLAVRVLSRRPVFTLAAVLSLALGIGANTAIFTLVNAAFLRPVPVDDPSRIVAVYATDEVNPVPDMSYYPFSFPNYEDLRESSDTLAEMAAYAPFQVSLGIDLPELVPAHLVTESYFEVLGGRAQIGRTFLPEEDATLGSHPVTVISHSLWQNELGGSRDVVGRDISLNGRPFTVVGVMPRGFRGPSSLGAPKLWIPTMMHREVFPFSQFFDQRRWRIFWLLGRLEAGVDPAAAEDELEGLTARLEEQYPEENRGRGAQVLPLTLASVDPNQRETFARAGKLLLISAGLVLLIACVNVGNLLLARGIGRRKEMALRLSFGARRSWLVRQLVTEGLVLALAGGALGLLIGRWTRDVLWSFRPPFMDAQALDVRLDLRVLLFTLGISILAGVLFSLFPARRASRQDLVPALKDDGGPPSRSSVAGRFFDLRSILVVAQVGLCVMALIGAGLFLRSLRHSQSIDLGYPADELYHFSLNVGPQGYDPARGRELYRRLAERLEGVPGVRSAAVSETRLMVPGGLMRSLIPEGRDPNDSSQTLLVRSSSVGPEYFDTVGIPLLSGRAFTDADREGSTPTAIVNRTLAETLWPGEDPVGKRFAFFGEEGEIQVVGVAADARYVTVGEDLQPYLYLSMLQRFPPQPTFYLRTEREVPGLADTVRRELQALDPDLPVVAPMTLSEEVEVSLWLPRMAASLLTLFGLLALVLAVIGLYGVLTTTIRQRERELGIRSALGASRGGILGLVLRRALVLVACGVVAGLAASYAASRLIADQLAGVSATDGGTFLTVAVVLVITGMLAALPPARRAARVDPLVSLKAE